MEQLMWVAGSWEVADDPVLESTSAVSEVGGRQMGRVLWSAVTAVCRRKLLVFMEEQPQGELGFSPSQGNQIDWLPTFPLYYSKTTNEVLTSL